MPYSGYQTFITCIEIKAGGSSGNRTLPDGLRARCSALELTTRGAPGNRTRLSRIKSPQHHLDANTPLSCFGPAFPGLDLRFIWLLLSLFGLAVVLLFETVARFEAFRIGCERRTKSWEFFLALFRKVSFVLVERGGVEPLAEGHGVTDR